MRPSQEAFCRVYLRSSGGFLLEGCADGIRAGGCIAGADVDLFSGANACAVVVNAIGDVAGNAGILMTGLTGFFGRIVHNLKILSIKKFTKDGWLFRSLLCSHLWIVIHQKIKNGSRFGFIRKKE